MSKITSLIVALFVIGCTPANPIQLSESPDGGLTGVDFPDESNADAYIQEEIDASSASISIDASAIDTADGTLTDMMECTGGDCDENEVVPNETTDSDMSRPCAHNIDCASTSQLCRVESGFCAPIKSETQQCGDGVCTLRQNCTACTQVADDNAACVDTIACTDESDICQGKAGAECQNQCECADTLICDLETRVCAECLPLSDQCDETSECNDAGLCAPFYRFPSESQDVIRRLLVERLVAAAKMTSGDDPVAFMTLSLTPPITEGDDELDEILPSILLGDGVDRCGLIDEVIREDPSVDEQQQTWIEGVFGCAADGSQPNRFLWTDPLTITDDESALACLVYQPRMAAIDDSTCVRWRLWLGPCQLTWQAQLPEGVCAMSSQND